MANSPTEFGRMIRTARRAKELKQTDVAAAGGIATPTLSMLETGDRQSPPSPKAIVGIAKFLGLDPLRLLKVARPEDVRIIGALLAKERR